MKALEVNREIFTWLCIFPPTIKTSQLKKKFYILFSVTNSFLVTVGFISSVVFVVKNIKKNWEESLYALFQVAGLGQTVYTLCASYILKDKIVNIFSKLQKIHDECK